MWVLCHITTGRRFYLLANTKKYTVGRAMQNDLSLPDDNSVSREHAVIYRSSSGIRVEDNGSKYGVFVNNGIDTNSGIGAKNPVELQAGNIVRFGRLSNTFRLENIEINLITSTVPQADMDKLSKVLKVIDAKVFPTWNTEATHLIMTHITITVKVLQALAYGLPIVTPSYFDAYLKSAMVHSTVLPDVKDFIPQITEPFIIKEPGMMGVHLDRKRLFHNKIFIFMVKKHMDRFESIIKLAGGNCANMENDSVKKTSFLKSEYIPVLYESRANSQCSSDIGGITKYIEKHNRRMINDSEIGLAIIHRDIDRFCNPDRKLVTDFQPVAMDTKDILKNVIIGETPHSSNTMKPALQSLVIPETIELPDTEPNNNLRRSEAIDLDKPSNSRRSTRSSVNNAANVAKKIPTPKKNQKRKAELDEINDQQEMDATDEAVAPQKKQKANDQAESQGERNSAVFAEPMPPQSPTVHNFSGFISTQRHKKRKPGATKEQSPSTQSQSTPDTSQMGRKRLLEAMNKDSDEEEDKVVSFKFVPKRAKVTAQQSTHRNLNQSTLKALDDDDDDDDKDLFNFSKKPKSKVQTKQKTSPVLENDETGTNAQVSNESQKKTERSFKSYGRPQIKLELSDCPTVENKWVLGKIKRELKCENDESNSEISSIKIKEEDLDGNDDKNEWIKNLQNMFISRKNAINITRRSMVDETDSLPTNSANETHNKSLNSKTFSKKNEVLRPASFLNNIKLGIEVSCYARL